MATDIATLGTILGIWAHPDDETYLSAGIMAAAARAGARVVCVTATRGELGSWDEERWPTATMGQVREEELLRSLAVLGVEDHRWLDYHDGRCEQVPMEEGVERVRALIEEIHPDTVLTFGPDGMTGHADHKAVCAWTTEAFARARPQGARLCYATVTPEWRDRFVDRMNEFDVFAPGTPVATEQAALEIDFPLPPDVLDLKMKAIAEHVSQVQGMLDAFGEDFFRVTQAAEWFRRA